MAVHSKLQAEIQKTGDTRFYSKYVLQTRHDFDMLKQFPCLGTALSFSDMTISEKASLLGSFGGMSHSLGEFNP